MFRLSLKQGLLVRLLKNSFLTQPNLSASIRDLEEELGVQLFERSNTGAKLTDDGHDFLKYAKRILGELDLLEGSHTVNHSRNHSLLPVTTTISYHFQWLTLPNVFVVIIKNFKLIETTTRKILKSVESFESDLGIIYLDEDNDHILERSFQHMDLTFTPLGEFETKIFLGRQHPLAHKKSLNLKDLEGYPQVRFRQESSGIHFDEDPLEVLPDQQVIYSNDRGSVMNLLCASDSYASGLGIVNSFIKDQIVLLPLKNSPKHTLGFVTNNKQKQSAIIQAFIEEIQDSLLPHH